MPIRCLAIPKKDRITIRTEESTSSKEESARATAAEDLAVVVDSITPISICRVRMTYLEAFLEERIRLQISLMTMMISSAEVSEAASEEDSAECISKARDRIREEIRLRMHLTILA